MKYRKRSLIIEATEHLGPEPLDITTAEGTQTAQPGDFIITGVDGKAYPCKRETFFQLYDPIHD